MVMSAVVFDEYGALPALRTVGEPVCPEDGVLIRVGATGVCRSDWHAWKGHDPAALPHVPGHALAGVGEPVGPEGTRGGGGLGGRVGGWGGVDGGGALPALRTGGWRGCPGAGGLGRVGAAGVGRSDWHAWKGHDPGAPPRVPGHELAGVVETVGPDVTRWRAGDRVTVPFVCGCGRCEYCLAGEAQVCPDQTQPGFTGPGSFAELVAIHAADTNLVRLPDRVDFVTAASLGCRLATAFRARTAH